MSAFIVAHETMDRCVAAILALREKNSTRFAWLVPELHKLVGTFSGGVHGAGNRIGAALYALNTRAVEDRYGKGELPGSTAAGYRYRWQSGLQPVQSFKSLDCLSYQCHEGDVPDTALYKELLLVMGDIAGEIIRRVPEYDRAIWDAER